MRKNPTLFISVALLFLSACAPTMKGTEGGPATVSFDIKGPPTSLASSLSALLGSGGTAATFSLSDNFCYAVHVTGNFLTQMNPSVNDACAMAPQGLGEMVGLFAKGATASLNVPLGVYRFDLIGFLKSSLPGATCTGNFAVKPSPPGSTHDWDAYFNGQLLTVRPQLIASRAGVTIVSGPNAFDLYAVANSSIGVPYGCNLSPTMTMRPVVPTSGVTGLSDGKITAFNVNLYTVGGICSVNGQPVNVSVNSGAVTYAPTCTANAWTQSMGLAGIPDGAVSIAAYTSDLIGNLSVTTTLNVVKNSAVHLTQSSGALPSTVVAGGTVAAALNFSLQDSQGNALLTPSLATLAGYSDAACTVPNAVTATNLSVTATNQASFTNVVSSIAGALYLQASVQPASTIYTSACLGPVTVTSSSLNQLAFTTFPTGALTSSSYNLAAQFQDTYGNPVTPGTGVTVNVNSYALIGCTTSATSLGTPATTSAAQSTVSLSPTSGGTGTVYIQASIVSPSAKTPCTALTVTGAPAHLLFANAPTYARIAAGTLQVKVVDSVSNAVTNQGYPLSLTLLDVTGNVVPLLSGTSTQTSSTASGAATFGDVRIQNPGVYSLRAVMSGVTSASAAFAVGETCAATLSGGAFQTGYGSSGDPFVICSAGQFENMNTVVDGTHSYSYLYNFLLMNDLDLTGIAWAPVGTYGNSGNLTLNGNFDGGGHQIRNLSMASTANYRGLFGVIDSGATVKNLYLDHAVISSTAPSYVGALAGQSYGNIQNVHVTNVNGTSAITGASYVGGLVGYQAEGLIANSSSSANVVGYGNVVGGLVGELGNGVSGATIQTSYAAPATSVLAYGTGSSGLDAGGLVGAGMNLGQIMDAYAFSAVGAQNSYAGGLIGAVSGSTGPSIQRSFAGGGGTNGGVSVGVAGAGGLVGYLSGTFSGGNNFWDTTGTAQSTTAGSAGGTGLSSSPSTMSTYTADTWLMIAAGTSRAANTWLFGGSGVWPSLLWQTGYFNANGSTIGVSADGSGLTASGGAGKAFLNESRGYGKWYWQFTYSGVNLGAAFGVANPQSPLASSVGYDTTPSVTSWGLEVLSTGAARLKSDGGTAGSTLATLNSSSVIGVALDLTAGNLSFYNGASLISGATISLGSTAGKTFVPVAGQDSIGSDALGVVINTCLHGLTSCPNIPAGYTGLDDEKQ